MSWRISVVKDLGEAIAVRGRDGRVELLATNVAHEMVAMVLAHLPTRWSLAEARLAVARLADVDGATIAAFLADAAAFDAATTARHREIRRAGFVCRAPAELPDPDVDVDSGMRAADWPTIGAWALTLFCDPIGLTEAATYVNGRHRSACLRLTASPIAVISSTAAEAAAERRLVSPPRPIVSWL